MNAEDMLAVRWVQLAMYRWYGIQIHQSEDMKVFVEYRRCRRLNRETNWNR